MALTPSQQNAVDVRDRTLLVSAAAGSGKTYTLTQRIIKAIIDDGQDLSRLLIVTFTRAAAGELRAKISKALSEAIAEHPENIHLQKQLIKLGQAHISTIDSFFSEPVRANFEKLGLPASMRLADESELAPIRDRMMQEALDGFFDRCDPYSRAELSPVGYKNSYTALMGIISGSRDFSNIIPTFFDIYKKLITSPKGLEQLKYHSERLKESASIGFFDTLEGKALKDETTALLTYAWRTFRKCADEMSEYPIINDKYRNTFEDNANLCHITLNAIETNDFDNVMEAFCKFEPSRIPNMPKDQKSDKSEYYRSLRSDINGDIKRLIKDRFYLTQGELSELFLMYSEMCSLLYSILSSFDEKYAEEKKHRGICEFSDMPKFMLSLLLDRNGNPTEYAKNLSESFDEVYIDEYQDVNEIQDTIFDIIGGCHRFMVGDIKQSIYGFREAEPSIFADYRNRFPIYNKDTDSSGIGNTIFMSENFRCDENVIKFTNAVCANIFSAFSKSIGYTSSDDLKFGKGRPYEEYQSPKVTINIVQPSADEFETEEQDYDLDNEGGTTEDFKNLGDEAIIVANEIAELLKKGKNADRTQIRPGNIAILVRSHVYTRPLVNALNALNIKSALSSKSELFENEDMRLLTDLLSVIDNPRDDMPLCHLLTANSDIYTQEFSLEDVIKIRKASDNSRSLYDSLVYASLNFDDANIRERCASFVSLIERMRDAAGKLSADKLIKSIVSSERYSSLTTTDAYTFLYDSACRYVKNNWSSLYSFINYFKDVMERGESGGEPDTRVDDSVRIMSIHQSKGLEFNVCFLFGFGKQFNMQNRFQIIFNKEFGPYMKLPPISNENIIDNISTRYQTNPIFKTVDKYIKLKQLEEEARIFYVALTRAREKLYISATLKKPYEEIISGLINCADTDYEIKLSKTYINWILLSLCQDDIDDITSVKLHDRGKCALTSPIDGNDLLSSHEVTDDERNMSALLNSKSIRDPLGDMLASVPAKVAASKVSSHMLDDSIFIPLPIGKMFSENDEYENEQSSDNSERIMARISLMRSQKTEFDALLDVNKKPTAAEKGTAAHAFLQFCNYENVENHGIDYEISRLEHEKFISSRTAEIINRTQLKGFFKSDLYNLLKSARVIHREFHFGMFRNASDFTESIELKEHLADRKIYVQGSIDLLFECENGDIIVCDYKTDRISENERADRELLNKNMRQKHAEQLEQYAYAVKEIFGRSPARTFIYSIILGDMIEII